MYQLRQWTEKNPLKYIAFYFLIYCTWFFLLENFRHPVLYISSALDYKIPFCQYFVIPYLLWFFFIGGTCAYFYKHSRRDLMNVCRYLFTGMTICLLIYTVVPTGLHLRGAVTGTDICSRLVSMLYSTDTSTNVCPSIHVFNSIAVTVVILQSEFMKNKKVIKLGAVILSFLICLSTMFLKQHSVIDVFWGFALSLVLYPLSYRSVLAPDPSDTRVTVHL